jgi:hypothetical protein
MAYSHKVIFFTGSRFNGGALVVMGNEGGTSSFEGLKYRNSNSKELIGLDPFLRSLVAEKGKSDIDCPSGDGTTNDIHVCGPFVYKDSSERSILKTVRFSNTPQDEPKYDVQFESKTYWTDDESPATHYFLTFYPTKNAYFIFPAPLCELIEGRFRWVLGGEETFIIDWDSDEVEYAYLEFFPHKESGKSIDGRARPSPINVDKKLDAGNNQLRIEKDKDSPDDWVSPLAQYVIQRGEKIKMVKNSANSFWEFNFCCKIGKRIFVVDPETKYGSGT